MRRRANRLSNCFSKCLRRSQAPKHPVDVDPFKYNIDDYKSLRDSSMPVPQQRVELLALAKLRNPDEKLLIEEALARLKVGIDAAIKHEQTVTWEKLGF